MRRILACLGIIFFMACESENVTLNYKIAEPVRLDLIAESNFSTIDLNGDEKLGTITSAYDTLEYSSKGDTVILKRYYNANNSKGYLKNFMPSELAFRIDSVALYGIDREVVRIENLEEGYDSLLAGIPMPSRWKNQLLNPSYKPHLKRLEKHRWEMSHLLTGTVPSAANITKLLQDQGRLNFALIKIDSVVTNGFRKIDKRRCLEYTVYLQETESFPYYIWEQHVNSNIIPEEFKQYTAGHKAEYDTRYQVLIDPINGVLCQEWEVKNGRHTMVHPATQDTVVFKSIITHERLYNIRRGEEKSE